MDMGKHKFKLFQLYSDFDLEIIKSEYNRTRLMLVALAFLTIFSIAMQFFFRQTIISLFGNFSNFFILIGWLLAMLLFEAAVLWRIHWFGKRGLLIGKAFRFTYCLIEVSFPSIIMLSMMDARDNFLFLESSIYLLYFFIILLSTLHLDFRLSLMTGLLACVQYSYIVFYAFHFSQDQVKLDYLPEITYYIRCLLLFLSGAAAGFVAEEIKKRLKSYITIVDSKTALELTFGQQVSEEVAHALMEQGEQARQMEVTVMVLDIRDFTIFADHHLPAEILTFQNKIFGPILTIIQEYNGIVNQILGDGIMATFGAPVASADHAQQAFDASLAILEKVKKMSLSGEIPEIRLGIGLNSGEVVTGNIGTASRKQYSFSGTAVIIAFRVEQLNKEFDSEFLITEKVKNTIDNRKEKIEPLGFKSLKGLYREIELYRVR
jgi:adenylate cyclase